MLEPDTTTSEVLLMYVGIFVILFGVAFILLKKNS
jgi:LPXTG-motif cell wall-anchored protein